MATGSAGMPISAPSSSCSNIFKEISSSGLYTILTGTLPAGTTVKNPYFEITPGELITGIVVVLSIIFWTTDRYHHLPSFVIGTGAMAVFAFSGILRDEDIGSAVSWSLLLYLGGVFGLANVIQDTKVTDWLAGFIVPVAQQLTSNLVLLMAVLAVSMFVLRFLDPSSFIAISVLFLSVVDVTNAAGIPPLVVMAAVFIASAPFWMSYQNFWLAMGEGLTGQQAFDSGQRVKAANAYAIFTLVALAVGVGYWKLVGVIK